MTLNYTKEINAFNRSISNLNVLNSIGERNNYRQFMNHHGHLLIIPHIHTSRICVPHH